MTDAFTLTTTSPEQTESLGAHLLRLLPDGAVVALRGDLAAGKTCLVRGMASGAAVEGNVNSPTFTIVNVYVGTRKIYHLDLYRLGSLEEVIDLGYEELFEPEDAITVVEWAERAGPLLPAHYVDIQMEHAGGDSRRITITNHGVLPEGMDSLRSFQAV